MITVRRVWRTRLQGLVLTGTVVFEVRVAGAPWLWLQADQSLDSTPYYFPMTVVNNEWVGQYSVPEELLNIQIHEIATHDTLGSISDTYSLVDFDGEITVTHNFEPAARF